MSLVLSSELMQKIAGWQAVKEARGLMAAGKVIEASWNDPELRGVVQTSAGAFKTGLTIHSSANVETHCTCRQARQEGTICAHAVAVALHVIQPPVPPTSRNGATTGTESATRSANPTIPPASRGFWHGWRAGRRNPGWSPRRNQRRWRRRSCASKARYASGIIR